LTLVVLGVTFRAYIVLFPGISSKHTPTKGNQRLGSKSDVLYNSPILQKFGTCDRDIANYFISIDYGYDFNRLHHDQTYRDNDLLPKPVEEIFDSSNGNVMTRRWAGCNFNYTLNLEFAKKVIAPFRGEWSRFPKSKGEAQDTKTDYYRGNGMHEGSDPILLHSIIRTFKPQRVVEIGSGFSSRVTVAALAKNEAECGKPTEFTIIDPLTKRVGRNDAGLIVGPTNVHESWLEDDKLEFFTSHLGPGDIFFIDSSHALGKGGSGERGAFFLDVMIEYSELLPRLQPGVIVHIHDIPWPDHFWFVERNWAEQLVLQAFLSNNPYFDIIWCGGANKLPWAHLENKGLRKDASDIEAVHNAAMSAFGESINEKYYHVRTVGKKRPFAGGRSIWIRRNMKQYVQIDQSMGVKTPISTKDFLVSPTRTLVGWSNTSPESQTPLLKMLASKYSAHASCLSGVISSCVVCALLENAGGLTHIFGKDLLLNCGGSKTTVLQHDLEDLPRTSLETFTRLGKGDSIVLSSANLLNNHRRGKFLASAIFVTEVAPRLSPGVTVILYGISNVVSDIVFEKKEDSVGQFIVQAWGAMNDAFEVLWIEDSNSAQAAGFAGKSKSDHVVALQRK